MLMVGLVGFTSLFVAACNDNDSEAGRVYSADCIRFNLQGVQSMPDANFLPRNVAFAAGETRAVPIEGDGAEGLELVETAVEGIATMDNVVPTRGILTSKDNFASMNKPFSIFACKNGSQVADYIYNEKVNANGTMVKPMRWTKDDAESLTFYAVHPAVENEDMDTSLGKRPRFNFTVSSDAENQVDLLIAGTKDLKFDSVKNSVVPINFTHVTTAIQFKIGRDFSYNQKIKTIEILKVKGEGTFDAATRQWTLSGANKDFKLTFDPVYPTAQQVNTLINVDKGLFFMLPQELSTEAMIKITFESGKYWTAKIGGSGKKWVAGMTKTYTITNSKDMQDRDFVLSVGAKGDKILTYNDSTATIKIESYRHLKGLVNDTTRDVKERWSVSGYRIDGGAPITTNVSDMIKLEPVLITERGADIYKVRIKTDYKDVLGARNNSLKNATPSVTPKDLSIQPNGKVETANCYIVSAGGEYMFPAVYGNAKKDGKTNTAAYKPGGTGGNVLAQFFHGTGKITDPDITAGDKVEVLWQSTPGLVTAAGVTKSSGKNRFVKFRVDQTKMCEASAIIALKKGNTICWSWHIWITAPEVATTNSGYFMREPLGFRHTKWWKTTYDTDRKVTVIFKQERTGTTAELTFTQKPHQMVEGHAMYYQLGRKDPLCDADKFSAQTFTQNGGMTLKETVQHPLLMANYRNLSSHGRGFLDWNNDPGENNSYLNLWDGKNNVGLGYGGEFVKTVYDPSPAGFRVPRRSEYSKLKPDNGGNKVAIPFLGYLHPEAIHVLQNRLGNAYFWSSDKIFSPSDNYAVYGASVYASGEYLDVWGPPFDKTHPYFGYNLLSVKE